MPSEISVQRQSIHRLRRVADRVEVKRNSSGLSARVKHFLAPVQNMSGNLVRWLGLGSTVNRIKAFGASVSQRVSLARQRIAVLFKNVIIRSAMLVYRIAYRRRHALRSGVTDVSGALYTLQTSEFANKVLRLAATFAARRTPIVGPIFFFLLGRCLVVVAGTHLAAGQNARALSTARLMNILFRKTVLKKSNSLSRAYFEVLRRQNLFQRIAFDVPEYEPVEDFYLNRIFGVGHLYRLNSVVARKFFEKALTIHDSYYEYLMLGRTYLIDGSYIKAAKAFEKAANIFPPIVMAHQNYAGRYDVASYKPLDWELADAGRLMIYDNLGQFAEEQFLHGNLDDSMRIYQKLLHYQDRISVDEVLPEDLIAQLQSTYTHFDAELPIRILPYEWVTQFGHIGLLSAFIKMAHAGIVPIANYLILAPADKTVNEEFLTYWRKYFCVVTDESLVNQLFPYQRFFGENFMVCRSPGEVAEPWTRAAARAEIAWSASSHEPLIVLTDEDREIGQEALRRMNVPVGAWYVGLHAREGGYYLESSDGISRHRNSQIEDYFSAIEEIVKRGGIVIRLGDASMRPMPTMEGVIDYAHSPEKSRRMDLFLLATCRFVIGTTSGLTTATHAFGTPTVLVNCISNDWQLWDGQTDFIFKKVYDRNHQRYLTLAEVFCSPIQGYLMNNTVLERNGYTVHSNTADEIHVAVRYKLDVISQKRPRVTESDELMKKYRRTISGNPFIFGAALPVPDFLKANKYLLGDPNPNAFPAARWTMDLHHLSAQNSQLTDKMPIE